LKKYFYIFLLFLPALAWSQALLLKPNQDTLATPDSLVVFHPPSARDSILARAEIALLERAQFGCQLDTVLLVSGNSQKLGYLPDEIPKFIALINGTKKFCLQVKQLDNSFFSYKDTLNGIWGRFLVSHQPGVIIVYSEGQHQPKKAALGKGIKRLAIKVATMVGAIDFPVNGRAFLILTYTQEGNLVINNFQIFLDTGHKLTNTYANDLIKKKKYKTIAAKAIAGALEKTFKKTEPDSLALPQPALH
jgi:hypothetical protein